MSFEHCISAFGAFEKHELTNEKAGCKLSLVPGHGACVLEAVYRGVNILDGYQTPEELNINRWGKNVLLFPFPNRMKDGRYVWRDEYFFFPINDPSTHTALHGFGMAKKMKVTSLHCGEDAAQITCTYQDAGRNQAYPFLFSFSVTFDIHIDGTMQVEMSFSNDGVPPIPVGFGWHPYFKLSEKVDTVELQLPTCQLVGIDQQMIPTGKRYDYDDFASQRRIGTTVLDNCFALANSGDKAEVKLKGEFGELHYWQETGPHHFNFLQVFTPPHRQSLAVEPMTCNVNAFNNQEGLIILQPGETASAAFGWQFLQ